MECKNLLQKEYTVFVLSKGKRPASVKAFTDSLQLLEKDFYHLYRSFDDLEYDIFESYFQETIEKLANDTTYQGYSSVEKMLAFYYAWFEKLAMHRSFITWLEQQKPFISRAIDYLPLGNKIIKFAVKQAIATAPPYLHHVRTAFKKYIKPVINEGLGEELADRFWIAGKYDEVLWGQTILLYRYWLNDRSQGFEKTDAAIEKSVHFTFELLRPNAWDAGFDLIRFMVSGKQS